MGRFLLDAEAVALAVKLRHAVALRVVDIISEDGRLVLSLCVAHALLEQPREARAVEDVVAQDEADAVLAHKLLADDEGLGQSVGTRLLGIAEAHTQLAAIAQQTAEARQVVGRGDDEDVADAGEHQRRDGIIDHRLVIYGDELLADALGDGVEAGAGSASQNDSFHVVFCLLKNTCARRARRVGARTCEGCVKRLGVRQNIDIRRKVKHYFQKSRPLR